jgi:hypothetical protein
MFTPANLFGSFLFGLIGMAAVTFGKKEGRLNPMILGFVLMAYPYFISRTWLLYVVGTVLTGALWRFPD